MTKRLWTQREVINYYFENPASKAKFGMVIGHDDIDRGGYIHIIDNTGLGLRVGVAKIMLVVPNSKARYEIIEDPAVKELKQKIKEFEEVYEELYLSWDLDSTYVEIHLENHINFLRKELKKHEL